MRQKFVNSEVMKEGSVDEKYIKEAINNLGDITLDDENELNEEDIDTEGLREFVSKNEQENCVIIEGEMELRPPRRKFSLKDEYHDITWSPDQGFVIGGYLTRGGSRNHLGKGSVADVYKGWDKIHRIPVAIKVIHVEKFTNIIQLKQYKEGTVLSQLNHENIIKFIDSGDLSLQHKYIILEYCNMGNLESFIESQGPLPEVEAKEIISHLVRALQYLESKQLLHRDIKPSNILLKSNGIGNNLLAKLADFSLVKECKSSFIYEENVCGSPMYWVRISQFDKISNIFKAPEIWREGKFSFKSEIYSIGLILYQMLTGRLPWNLEGKTIEEIQRIKATSYRVPDNVSQPCKELLVQMLQSDVNQRIDTENLYRHPWLAL